METLPSDLADSLDAAADAANRLLIHHDLCQQFDPEAPRICTCGVPRLLADLAAVLLGQREPVVAQSA